MRDSNPRTHRERVLTETARLTGHNNALAVAELLALFQTITEASVPYGLPTRILLWFFYLHIYYIIFFKYYQL